jgi:hemoglobin/transferrin/lactoferrin receptor protein
MPETKLLLPALGTALLVSFYLPLAAQEASEESTLEPMIVESISDTPAPRLSSPRSVIQSVPGALDPVYVETPGATESTFESPYSAEQIDEQDLIERSARNVPEALQYVPGVLVQKTAHGQGSPFIRGFTGYHTLLLVDGIRVNNAAFRSGPNQYFSTIDAQGLSSIDLVKSQGSVLYGSDAVGGTLQAVTRRPLYAESGQLTSGRSYTRLASAEDSIIQRNEVSVSEAGSYGLIIGATYKDFGDINAADLGRLPHTGYGEWDVDAKLELFFNPDTRLTFFHQEIHQDDAWRTHSTLFSVPFEGTAVGSDYARILDQDRLLTYLQLDGKADSSLFDHYTVSVSHQRQGEQQYRSRSGGRTDWQGFDLDSYGVSAQFDLETEVTDLSYGFSYYLDQAESFRDDFTNGILTKRSIQGPIGDDATYHLGGIFVNTSTPVGARLTLDLGARYTHAAASIGEVESSTGAVTSLGDQWDDLSGSGRISYQLDDADHFRAFAGISQAFRSPNFSDLSRYDANRSNEIETPAPGLSPEHFLTYEIGLKASHERFTGSLTYYYTAIDDLIQRTPTGRIIGGLNEVSKQNIGEGHVQGVELSGAFEVIDDVTLFGGFAYQDSLVSTYATSAPILTDEPLSRLLPLNGFGGVRFDLYDGRGWAEALVQGFAAADRLSSSDLNDVQRIPPGGTAGYTLVTLRGGYHISENFLITAGVENLLDEAYRAHGSGQNEPGANFIFGAEVKF